MAGKLTARTGFWTPCVTRSGESHRFRPPSRSLFKRASIGMQIIGAYEDR